MKFWRKRPKVQPGMLTLDFGPEGNERVRAAIARMDEIGEEIKREEAERERRANAGNN